MKQKTPINNAHGTEALVTIPLEDWILVIKWPNEDSAVLADICFDCKRRIGCYVCPLYRCSKKDL